MSMTPPDIAAGDAVEALYEALVQSRGSEAVHDETGRLRTAYALMLLDPTLGTPIEALGSRLRLASPLPSDVREVAILAAASAARCVTQWSIHLPIARRAGITVEELGDELGEPPSFDSEIRGMVWRLALAWAVGEAGRPTDRRGVIERYETVGLYELVTTVGYYRLLAMQLAVFEEQ